MLFRVFKVDCEFNNAVLYVFFSKNKTRQKTKNKIQNKKKPEKIRILVTRQDKVVVLTVIKNVRIQSAKTKTRSKQNKMKQNTKLKDIRQQMNTTK